MVETGEPLVKDSLIYDDTFGEQRLVRAFDIRATKLNDGFVASWRDITDRKQMEVELNQTVAALQQQQHKLQRLIDTAPIGIGIGSANGEVRVVNDAMLRLHGYTREEFDREGMNWRDFVSPEETERTEQAMSQLQQQGFLPSEEKELLRKDGTRLPIWISAMQWMDGTDEHIAFAVDLTRQKQAQAALKDSQQRYRELAEAMPQMVWTADATGAVNYWNQRWYEYTGLSETESIGLAGANTVHPDDRDRTLEQWSQSTINGESFEIEYRIRRWDGVSHWFICRAIPTGDNQGNPTGWIGTITDIDHQKQLEQRLLNEITQHQRIEQDLRAANQQIVGILESITDAYVAVDRDWRITYVNQMTAQINQIAAEDLIGKSHWDVWAASRGTVCEANYLRAMTEQIPVHFEYFYEPRQRWYEIHAYPSIDGLGIYYRDIHDRKQADQELSDSEERFRTLADHISQLVWMTDENGWIFWYNQRWFDYTGTTLEEMQGWGWQKVHHPDHVERVVERISRCFETGETWEDTFPLRGRDGQYRWFLSRAIPIRDQRGKILRWFGTNTDITELRQTETALQQTTERLNIALKSAPLTLFTQDLDLRYTWVYNPTQNYSIEEIIDQRDEDLASPETAARLTQLKRQVLETGVGLREEVKVTRDGQTAYYDLTIDPLRDSQNRMVGITCAAIDISDRVRLETERQQAEIALADNEARLQGFVDANVVGILYGDIYGNIHQANDELLRIIGYTREDLRTGQLRWIDITPPEHLPLDEQAIAQARTDGACTPYEKEYIRKNGSRVPVLIGYSLVGEAREESVAFILDLSDRKQAETALRQSEDRLRMAIESAQLGTWDWNLITNELTWDAGCKAMFGLSPDATVTYETHLAGLHPDDRDYVYESGQQALHFEDGNFDVEYRAIGIEDGIERWIAAKGKVIFDSTGVPLRFIGTVLNITEKKRAEAEREQLLVREQAARAEAERANHIKDEFLAILSHELRSPLNPILGWTKLLQTRKFDEAQIAAALATIERNAKLQTQLIDDLLDVAKILRGKLSLNMTVVNLSFLIEAAIDTVRTAAAAKSISLHATLPNVGQVFGDAACLQQIVWNLLANAIKFTPNGGRVEIWLKQVGRQTEITVQDTGKGISPDFLPHIFESFRQEDTSTTRKYGGLGLGLAIVRQLVEAHGGTIMADSPGEGQGATFTVQLPLLNAEPELQQSDELLKQELNLTGIRVLAVDDDPDARELLTALLVQYGATVVTTTSAAEVIAALESFQPDVLVSDIGMPEVDGYTLIQQIRALPSEKGGQIPAIALTAYAREEDQQRITTSGYQWHVAKPLELEQLIRAVMTLVPNNPSHASG
ncbi:MAG: PAS domain S-box protein [Leptolyngbyaceae cyanobacterium SM1_4_3]|nr:PAS domain S-box protein [Leptolyngbyaceae cyanobacterium SM1_4_3]